VSKYYKNEVGYVGREEEPIRRFVEDWLREITSLMSAGVPVGGRVEGAKLRMLTREPS
jgi:hypothetical protein